MTDSGVSAPDPVLDELWPRLESENDSHRSGTSNRTRRFLALPKAAASTVLIPLRPRAAAAAVLRAHRAPSTRRAQIKHEAVVAAARVGASDFLARGGRLVDLEGRDLAILDHVAAGLAVPSAVGVHLGPPRANRKAVLQLVGPGGRDIAFAKVGTNALTRNLVRAEAQVLRRLMSEPFSHLSVPAVISSGQYREHEVLVLEPVRTHARHGDVDGVRSLAMIELSRFGGVSLHSLTASEHWVELQARLGSLNAADAVVLRRSAAELGSAAGEIVVPFGSWHGDWTPWNMAVRGDRATVWDWERFRGGVPLGWDALHYDVQTAIRRGGLPPRVALSATIERAPELLAGFGVPESAAMVVTAGYLVEVAARYLADDQQGAGSRLGELGQWLLPELAAVVSSIRGSSSS